MDKFKFGSQGQNHHGHHGILSLVLVIMACATLPGTFDLASKISQRIDNTVVGGGDDGNRRPPEGEAERGPEETAEQVAKSETDINQLIDGSKAIDGKSGHRCRQLV